MWRHATSGQPSGAEAEYSALNRWFLLLQPLRVDAGYIVPAHKPFWILLPDSMFVLWWDAMIRWLAVFLFLQIPMDIAFRGQERLGRWYYIIVQVCIQCDHNDVWFGLTGLTCQRQQLLT